MKSFNKFISNLGNAVIVPFYALKAEKVEREIIELADKDTVEINERDIAFLRSRGVDVTLESFRDHT